MVNKAIPTCPVRLGTNMWHSLCVMILIKFIVLIKLETSKLEEENTETYNILFRERASTIHVVYYIASKKAILLCPIHTKCELRSIFIIVDKWLLYRVLNSTVGVITWSNHAAVTTSVKENFNNIRASP